MKTIKIRVTQEDIDNGIRYKAESCPINHAARRAFNVDCSTQRTFIYVGYATHRAFLPETARDFIYHFDFGHPVAPFEFEITSGDADFVRDHLT